MYVVVTFYHHDQGEFVWLIVGSDPVLCGGEGTVTVWWGEFVQLLAQESGNRDQIGSGTELKMSRPDINDPLPPRLPSTSWGPHV